MPSGFQLRTAINDQFTHRPVLVTSWDGRCVPFPEHAYAEAGEADDGALDIVLSNWGAPRDSTDPIMLDIETHGGVYTDPRSSPDMLARIVQAVGRVKKLRPASNVGIFLTWTQSMAGAARTAAERTTYNSLILDQQALNNKLEPLLRVVDWVGTPFYRRPRTYADGTPFNWALRDAEAVAEVSRIVARAGGHAAMVAMVSPFVAKDVTGVGLPVDHEALIVPAMIAKASGWAGMCWWGNAANEPESAYLAAQVPFVEYAVRSIKPLLMRAGGIAAGVPVISRVVSGA